MNRLGNLVIDSISPNAAKGNKDFSDKLDSLSSFIYLSQKELTRFLENRDTLVWNLKSIQARHKHLVEFALKTWNPSTWHKS
ncbi:hypothetical protein NTGZN8_340020 [Candidatus Nitrotoga fabula]|uniref:GmrSD restriction endonucleases C-terminal domain-containing protein n=1 Tax=Candidatus Nitrotoga fabula TaxID=2182327 RepID=A0A916BET7_9PROT|nr:hypothetical protein NTGZN8_340020 [Candidatus Nitrotoga fabula]